MRYFLIALFFSASLNGYCQEWSLRSDVGYAAGELKTFKKIMLVNEKTLSYEMNIGREYCFVIAAGLTSLRFSHDDTAGINIFYNRNFFSIPLSIKKYYLLSRNAKAYIDVALYGSYALSEKKEFKSSLINESKTSHSLGYSGGAGISIGYKVTLTKTISLDLNFNAQVDYLYKYYRGADKIKTNKRMIGIALYKKFHS